MINFFDRESYTQADLKELIDNQVEESTYLDFKSAPSLEKSDKKRAEIGKDVSAFANADGGIIIYGMKEQDHVADSFSFIDGNILTKEWLEHVISSQIAPRIENLHIYPVRVDNDLEQSIYIVKIPASTRVPHMSGDKYYRRYDFQSVPMQDYEVRNLFEKVHNSELEITELLITLKGSSVGAQTILHSAAFDVSFQVENISNQIEHHYKLELHFPTGLLNHNRNILLPHHIRDEDGYSIFSIGNTTPLFQNELTTMVTVHLELHPNTFKKLTTPILACLYYSNGRKEKSFEISDSLTVKGKSLNDWGW